MRLRRLLIEQYGVFERLDLALATEPGRINLIVAPNGAGKSMLRQAFHDLLFGYSTKSKMNFRYRAGLSLEAEAVTRSGEHLQFGWRQPGGRTFHDSADAAMAARFGAALGGIRPPQLEYLFALDTARLRSGGEELAQGGDSLGLALLSGTGELMSAKAARAELAARRDAVWEAGKTSRPLARASKALEDARKKTRAGVQLPVQRAREVTAVEVEQARLKEARERHAAMQEKASRLARIDRTRRFLEEHRSAAEWLAAHPNAPNLAESLADDLASARQAASLAAAKLADARHTLANDEEAVAALALDDAALGHAHELENLYGALGRTEGAVADIVPVQAERAGHVALMVAALRDLGVAVAVDQAASLLPRLADETNARQLIAQHATRLEAQDANARRVRKAQETLDHLDAEPVTPAAPLDALETLLHAIRADRDPARHLADTVQAVQDAKAAEAAALSLIPGWSGTGAKLRATPVLAQPAFERLDTARKEAAATLREVANERDRLAADRDEWRRSLQEMHERPLPDQDTINQSRRVRDQVWQLIYRRVYAGEPADPAQERALVGEEVLPLAFARLVRTADELVDLRLLELPRVKEAERLASELQRTEADFRRLVEAVEQAQTALDRANAAFGSHCATLGLDPQATIGDVRHALAQRTAAIAAGLAADVARQKHQAVVDGQAEWAGQLRRLLAVSGTERSGQPFATLLAAADRLLQAEAEAKAARIQQVADRRSATRALSEAQADLRASEQALEHWQQRWTECLAALGRPEAETPAATEAVLQCLTGLAKAHTAASDLGKRVVQMQAEIAAFTETVTGLTHQLGANSDRDVFATARRLIARHESAQRQRALYDAAHERLLKTRTALQDAIDQDRDARQRLRAIVEACGAADGDQADSRIAASRDRAFQEKIRDGAAAGLREHGEGLSFTALQADAEDVTPDQAAAQREETRAALTAARDASDAAASRVRELEQRLDHAAAETELSDSVRQEEGAAATFGHLLDDYLILALAEQMLAQSVAEVEARAGSNGVSRIGAAFACVTSGDYTIEAADGEDGRTILKAVEHRWPNEQKFLAQLSEGTRDQLYLALRFVAIEDHAAAAAPLPFVADDILQTFDDTRALAALQALLALSQHTQVIVLTHHPHVAALAGSLPSGSVHFAAL
jgi:uncharacterized protein YhaN